MLRLHETLCFLQAYPDDRRVLDLADRALEAFPARVRRLGPSAAARLYDSGIAGTTLDYEQSLMSQKFVFKNPNATHSCSCGESFAVD